MIKKVRPAQQVSGRLTVPPDKSISHRSALFASLSEEVSLIKNYSQAADPQSTLHCLKSLGVPVKKKDNEVVIEGVGRDGFIRPGTSLDCGNSGTTMRLLTGIVAGAGIACELTGDESLSARTMKRIINPLNELGCKISGSGKRGEFAPIKVKGHNGLKGMRYPLPIASAQLKSAVLLAGLFGEEVTEVIEKTVSRDHTERLLGLTSEPFGRGKIIKSSREDKIPAQNYSIPGDFSSAAFWLVAGSIHEDAEIFLKNTGMNPSRNAAFHILKEMGANFKQSNDRMAGKEPVADIEVLPARLKAIRLDPALIPNCIDELPILMVAMCFARGTSVISGAEELRHKETDRLAAMGEILSAAGAAVELQRDGMVIHGKENFVPQPAVYKSCHDHRMAMAAGILATRAKDVSAVEDAGCTAISYPGFWRDLELLS